MLTNLLIGIAVVAALVILLLIIVALRPNDFCVARSAVVAAPASVVFAQVNDFHNWQAWSPYDKRDPAMKRTYEGPSSGVGASYTWNGNNEVGEGRSTIIESRPGELIRIQLEFKRPFAGTNTAEFAFQPQGEKTAVTWSLNGKYNLITKLMGLVISMDKMCGGDFEKGLASMKAVAEAAK